LDSCCGGPESATHCSIMEALDEDLFRKQDNDSALQASGGVK
jgi:hypothetical protein